MYVSPPPKSLFRPALGWHISRLCLNESSLKHRTGSSWVKLEDHISGFSCFGLLKVSSLALPFSLYWVVESVPYTLFMILMPVFHPLSLLSSLQGHTSEPQHDYMLLHSSNKKNHIWEQNTHIHCTYINLCKEMYLTIRASWSGLKYLYLVNINYTIGIVPPPR